MIHCGVYRINGPEHQFYIGSTALSFEDRWNSHRQQLRGGYHWCRDMQADWDAFGETYFSFEIIEFCTPDIVLKREQDYINKGVITQLLYNSRKPYKHITLRNGMQFSTQKEFAKACEATVTNISMHRTHGKDYDDIAAYFGLQPMKSGAMFNRHTHGDRISWKVFKALNEGLSYHV